MSYGNDPLINLILPDNSFEGVSENAYLHIIFKDLGSDKVVVPEVFHIYFSIPYYNAWLDFKCVKNVNCFYWEPYNELFIFPTESSKKEFINTTALDITDLDKNYNINDYMAKSFMTEVVQYVKILANTFQSQNLLKNNDVIIQFRTLSLNDGGWTGGTGDSGYTQTNCDDPEYTDVYTTGGTGGTGATGGCGCPNGQPGKGGLPGYYHGGTGGTGATGGVCCAEGGVLPGDVEYFTGGAGVAGMSIKVSSNIVKFEGKRLTIDLENFPLKPRTKYMLHIDNGAVLSTTGEMVIVPDISFTTGSE